MNITRTLASLIGVLLLVAAGTTSVNSAAQDSRCMNDGCHTMMYGYATSFLMEGMAENAACDDAQRKCWSIGGIANFCTIYETGQTWYGAYYAKARTCCLQCITSSLAEVTDRSLGEKYGR
jgi:hypothetical protein